MNRLHHIFNQCPAAFADIFGSSAYPDIRGHVSFYPATNGVMVAVEVTGLPIKARVCSADVFGFHIHEGTTCTGNTEDPFADTLGHFNPLDCPHPAHAGDLPPLFGNNGYAFMVVFTDRFTVNDIVGRTVIVHLNPDDFTTQPSGNSGTKIACGEIRRIYGN